MNALTTKHRCLGGEVQPWRQSLLATIASQFHWTECRWPFTTRPPQHACRSHPYASTDRVEAIDTGPKSRVCAALRKRCCTTCPDGDSNPAMILADITCNAQTTRSEERRVGKE